MHLVHYTSVYATRSLQLHAIHCICMPAVSFHLAASLMFPATSGYPLGNILDAGSYARQEDGLARSIWLDAEGDAKEGLQVTERSEGMLRQRAQAHLIQLLRAQRAQQDYQALRAARYGLACFLQMHIILSLIRLETGSCCALHLCRGVIHHSLFFSQR